MIVKAIKKRRECPRKRVKSGTILKLSTDIWLMVCQHLQNSPHAVFRLMMTCKSLQYSANSVWWNEFYNRVLCYQKSLKHSNFYHKLNKLSFFHDKRTVLSLVFNPTCYFCGTRFGHRLVKPLMVRTCQSCLIKNLVSNIVLELKYGISFSDYIETFQANGGIVVPLDGFKHSRRKALNKLSNDKYDSFFIKSPYHVQVGFFYFFMRSQIESLLNINLNNQEIVQTKRKLAAQTLSACFIRLATFQRFKKTSHPGCNLMNFMAINNDWYVRSQNHIKISNCWVPGGPTYSSSYHFPTNINNHSSTVRFRPGFNLQRVQNIAKILANAQNLISRLSAVDSSLPPFPKNAIVKI